MKVIRSSPDFPAGKGVDWSQPTRKEVRAAVNALKNNRSPDRQGVQPELLKAACDDEEVMDKLFDTITRVWNGGEPPRHWNESVMIPIYKGKGDFASLDNWRGISIQAWSRKVLMRCVA